MKKIKFLSCAALAAFMAFGLASCEKENFNTDANVTVTTPTINIPGIEIPEGYKPGDAVVSIQPAVNALVNGEILKVTDKAIVKFNGEESDKKYKVLTGQTIAAQEIAISVSYTVNVDGFEKTLEATDVVSVPEMKAGMVAIITPTIWLSVNSKGYVLEPESETELGSIDKEITIENKTDYWYPGVETEIQYVKEGAYVTNLKYMPGYENDPEVIAEVEKITNGIATEYDFGTVNIDVDVYAQSLTIIPISQVKVSTDYTIKRMIEWSRAIEEKVVATFTIEHFGAFTIDVERIKTNVNLEGEAHGHGHGKGHGHGHGDVPNAGGSIVDAL